ncbi:MAG: phosphocholine cytidylyltransferase family protein [bacterium]|nr:phosphocholine cytidylyltransferase family protein [bacterium]
MRKDVAVQAVIVAAGRGSRLQALTDDTPKCLLEIGGRSLLSLQIEALQMYGVKDLVVVTGYRASQIEALLPDSATAVYNPFWAETNNMASLWMARHLLSDDFVYLHCDVLFDPAILGRLLEATGEVVLSVERKLCDHEDMKVQIVDESIVRTGKELPISDASGEFIGLARVSRDARTELMAEIEELVRDGHLQTYFAHAIERLNLRGVEVTPCDIGDGAYWAEIDTTADLEGARTAVAAGCAPWVESEGD